ncbi:hypothetical protein [Azotobacter beijerinckii]|uniref:Uncharacterized protein n=1 Tax=Azotobacter beijerinckii TaxID=170623 RepID=A0A1I1B915_9GAMM|nr:hypothetical protein [Azotobacter beijerinckii]SFB46136.1 hypothetical protein SAMN04244571_02976 [Azotobacter beijerinckii]
MMTLDDLAARSRCFAMHLARLRDGRQPAWDVLEVPEADRRTLFYIMQRESLAALIAYLDALDDHRLIDLDDAERLRCEVAELGDRIELG